MKQLTGDVPTQWSVSLKDWQHQDTENICAGANQLISTGLFCGSPTVTQNGSARRRSRSLVRCLRGQ